MMDKVWLLINSVRFRLVVFGVASKFFAEVAIQGYSHALLFTNLSLLFAAVAGIGTVDKLGENLGKR